MASLVRAQHSSPSTKLQVLIHRRARANEVSIAVGIVYATDGRPELVVLQPRGGEGSLLSCVLVVPVVDADRRDRVRRAFERVVGAVVLADLDRADLFADADHRVDEA